MVTKVYEPEDENCENCLGTLVEGAELAAITSDQFREMLAAFDNNTWMQIGVIRKPDGTLSLFARESSEGHQFIKEAA